jgi:hypothetical protein
MPAVKLFQSIEIFLARLKIYTEVPATPLMAESIVDLSWNFGLRSRTNGSRKDESVILSLLVFILSQLVTIKYGKRPPERVVSLSSLCSD